jgi:uncharacterized integral membrane protein (TIGR00698 family)
MLSVVNESSTVLFQPSPAATVGAARFATTEAALAAAAPHERGLRLEHAVLALCALAVVVTDVPGFFALAGGVVYALAFGAPAWGAKVGNHLLKTSVVALGAGLDLALVFAVGAAGFGASLVTLAVAIGVGLVLARVLRIERDTALLVTVGTAICGGSAIAAAAPVLRARPASVGIAIGVVFLLNAAALVLFPVLGDVLQLAPAAFGEWCALAIHDTSSVVGAAASHGPEALEVATVTKLARSLWIVPVCLALALFAAPKPEAGERRRFAKPPVFVFAFVAAAALVSSVPALAPTGELVASVGRRGLVLALFAIGLSIDRTTLRQLRPRHLTMGVVLWVALAAVALALVV